MTAVLGTLTMDATRDPVREFCAECDSVGVTFSPVLEGEVLSLAQTVLDAGVGSIYGIYLHGSATLGDFVPGHSDLDVLVVINDGTDEVTVQAVAAALALHESVSAIGVEASVVDCSDARRGRPPWRFRAHVTTTPADRKVVDGRGHQGDPDLALHYLVVRAAGHAVLGPPPEEAFGVVDRDQIVEQLASELRWAAAEAPTTYAVLNACRALRFVEEDLVCSKTEAGAWALGCGLAVEMIAAALAARGEDGPAPGEEARAWVSSIADHLTG